MENVKEKPQVGKYNMFQSSHEKAPSKIFQ